MKFETEHLFGRDEVQFPFRVPNKVVSDIGYDSAHPGVGPAATGDELK